MKTPSLLVACCLDPVLDDIADESQHRQSCHRQRSSPHMAEQPGHRRPTAAASPATPWCAAFSRSSTGRLEGLDANGRACADCHMATDNFQLSPADAEARFRLLQRRRRFNPARRRSAVPADRRRTTSGSTARTRVTSAIFGRTASSGSPSRCPPNIKLIDPATNPPSSETSWTCGGACRRSTTWP